MFKKKKKRRLDKTVYVLVVWNIRLLTTVPYPEMEFATLWYKALPARYYIF